jgi:hypothetical protein
MQITKNKNGTYDLTGVSFGKLMAIVHSLDELEELHEKNRISSVAADVRDIIKNNPEFNKEKRGE